jgi:hypothetical protein
MGAWELVWDSILKIKGNDTFLDLTAKQVIQMRKDYGLKVKFQVCHTGRNGL